MTPPSPQPVIYIVCRERHSKLVTGPSLKFFPRLVQFSMLTKKCSCIKLPINGSSFLDIVIFLGPKQSDSSTAQPQIYIFFFNIEPS